jgi:DNA polymerase-3 subunit delta'
MSFADLPEQQQVIERLQRSLERGRLAHAYLFSGPDLAELETVARTLAKVLNCLQPRRAGDRGLAVDCCDACANCRKIANDNHADVQWVRPEAKSRQIRIHQLVPREESTGRTLAEFAQLKPTEGEYKTGIIVAADRITEQAANSFLKTLEEPPPKTVFILLTTDAAQLLETILSRCLRLTFAGEPLRRLGAGQLEWVRAFSDMAAAEPKGLLGRYRLLGTLLAHLAEQKERITKELGERSALNRYDDLDAKLQDRFEIELEAAVESEYRGHRADVLAGLHWWLRDVWLKTLSGADELIALPALAAAAQTVAGRLTVTDARQNLQLLEELQRLLQTNVQESLAIEVGLLRLKL